MADLIDVSSGDLITSARQNDINDYIEQGTHKINTLSIDVGGTEIVSSSRIASFSGLGIGIVPLRPFHISANSTDSEDYPWNNSIALVEGEMNSVARPQIGIDIVPTIDPASSSSQNYVAANILNLTDSENLDAAQIFGLMCGNNITGTADVLRAWGGFIQSYVMDTATVGTMYNFQIGNPVKAGGATITTNYGLHIVDQTNGSTNYNIYSEGTNSNNYFRGSVNIGDNKFTVDSNGNITKINNITTSFPSVQGDAGQVLVNNGSGTLTWTTPASGGGASMVFERKIEGDLYTTTLMPIVIPDELNGKEVKEVRLSVASLPTGAALKVDVRKNGTATTDSIFTSDVEIEIGTGQTATNGLYMVACDISGARVGTPNTTIDSARDDLASDDVLWVVLTQCGSVLAGTDLVVGISIE